MGSEEEPSLQELLRLAADERDSDKLRQLIAEITKRYEQKDRREESK
jgi:hypothetical protein